MERDISPKPDSPAYGLPLRIVAETLGLSVRQVQRLERRGILDSWGERFSKLYGLEQVRRLARERRRQAAKDSRVARPSDALIRILEHASAPALCELLAKQRGMTPEQVFWQFVRQSAEKPSPKTREEYRLLGDLAALAVRSGA